jgi:hypothetical protein
MFLLKAFDVRHEYKWRTSSITKHNRTVAQFSGRTADALLWESTLFGLLIIIHY